MSRKIKISIFIILVSLIASTIVFNRMYISYRHENKALKKEINEFTAIDNGLVYEKTGIDKKIKELYANAPLDCGKDSPSYECSGLFIHGLRLSEQESPWSHRDIDKETSVAFSFLRKDHKYSSSVDYSSGIILIPLSELNENKYDVLCAYPTDGWTDAKKSNRYGCGSYNEKLISISKDEIKQLTSLNLKKNSGNCADYDIKTVSDWVDFHKKNNYFANNSDFLTLYTCSFDMKNSNNKVSDFNLLADIRVFLNENPEYKPHFDNNEILVSAWDAEKVESLPVMAIFYTKYNKNSLNNALLYQRSFFDKTNKIIPIVEIKFPTTQNDEAEFVEYVK